MAAHKQELLDALVAYLTRHGLADQSLLPMAAAVGTSARLLVYDLAAYEASAARVAAFVPDRPVSYAFGGHVEKDSSGGLFDWESTYHPDEHALALGKADVLALPAALTRFNGFYSETGGFAIMDPMRNLIAFGLAALVVLIALGYLLYRMVRRIRSRRRGAA